MKTVDITVEPSASDSSNKRNALLSIKGEASCSLWWEHVPPFDDHRLGVVGEYQSKNLDASKALLDEACTVLKERGRTLAVGPMDGVTWRKYRLVIKTGDVPPFFMEPDNPPEWPGFFCESGFQELAYYSSSLCTDLSVSDPRVDRVRRRLSGNGINIRQLRTDNFNRELSLIYGVAAVSFQENFLYTPLPEEAFISQYLPLKDEIVPELVFMAEEEDRLVGFLFAIPDFAQAGNPDGINRVIAKTLAVLPGKRYGGLGRLLVEDLHQTARRHGFKEVIHALQHDGNAKSRNLSSHYGTIFRRYALFSKSL